MLQDSALLCQIYTVYFIINLLLQYTGYMAVYQGLNPIGGLLVQNQMEQPNGQIVVITYTDDGTGMN